MIEQERTVVKALAARYGQALRADYLGAESPAMTTYTAALEALDVKRGHVHTVADWHRIGEKAQHTPADLTDDDLIGFEGFGGPSVRGRGPCPSRKARSRQRSRPIASSPGDEGARAGTDTEDDYGLLHEVFRCDLSDPEVHFQQAEEPHRSARATNRGARSETVRQVLRHLGAW